MEKRWEKCINEALGYLDEAESLATKAVRLLMASKGFLKHQIPFFGATFASPYEIIVIFDDDCYQSELEIHVAADMTKEEIIYELCQYAKKSTRALLGVKAS